jgi:hypothetical protein
MSANIWKEDWKFADLQSANAFVSNREPTVEEQLAGIEPQSHFEKACGKLGVEVIAANSATMPPRTPPGR